MEKKIQQGINDAVDIISALRWVQLNPPEWTVGEREELNKCFVNLEALWEDITRVANDNGYPLPHDPPKD